MKNFHLKLILLMTSSCGAYQGTDFATIVEGPKNSTVKQGEAVSLKCTFKTYDTVGTVIWLKAIHPTRPVAQLWQDSRTYELDSEEFYLLKEEGASDLVKVSNPYGFANPTRLVSELTINSAEKAHSGTYICHVYANNGPFPPPDQKSALLEVIPKPGN